MDFKNELINQKQISYLYSIFFVFLSFNTIAQSKNIDYKLSNSITQLLDTSGSIYFKNKQKHEYLYAKFSSSDGNTLISLSTTRFGSELYNLIILTNRYIVISETKRIPIIFEFDIDFSTILNDSSNRQHHFGEGGFMVLFDQSGKIIKYGGQQ
jgi:hypothetical protein